MKAIKIWDGIRVTIDGESEIIKDGMPAVFKCLNMDSPMYEECRTGITRHLFCFGHIDLTEAYPGHSVVLDVIPATNNDNEEEETEDDE